MLESKFQANLKKEIRKLFPGCIILKEDANDIPGIPDLIILYKKHWACLECKRSEKATHRPNQDYYVNLMNEMSFARFVYPENKEDVLRELSEAFES